MWIFFDEINTCNSMGLISEIFCNHTYRGKTIPERYRSLQSLSFNVSKE